MSTANTPRAVAASRPAIAAPARGVAFYRYVPNIITLARLALTGIFFVLLNLREPPARFAFMMWVALAVYAVAVGTDWLDGYLARSWQAESAFGRVVDPFVDKILVCGAFVFFSSAAFLSPQMAALFRTGGWHGFVGAGAITGVAPWMAVVLIAREFLVTGIRGLAESRGIRFGADWAGKVKMVVQCAAIAAILVVLATADRAGGVHPIQAFVALRTLAVWTTIVVTVFSATGYVTRAWRMIEA